MVVLVQLYYTLIDQRGGLMLFYYTLIDQRVGLELL